MLSLEPRDEIRIRDAASIVGRTNDGVQLSMVSLESHGSQNQPIFNFRNGGRSFTDSHRVLIPAAFYEFTAPTYATLGGLLAVSSVSYEKSPMTCGTPVSSAHTRWPSGNSSSLPVRHRRKKRNLQD